MITRYVNTASTPGGDGTTNATSGANRAYASLSEAEASLSGTLSDAYEFICEGSAADTTAVTFAGFTTSSTNRLTVRTTLANRHDGKWNTNKYRLQIAAPGWDINVITINVVHMDIDGIQINLTGSSAYAKSGISVFTASGSDIKISNNIIRNEATAGAREGLVLGWSTKAFNNIIYDWQTTGILARWWNSATSYLYNNTIYNCGNGIRRDNEHTVILKNNIAYNNTDNYVGTFDASSTNNLSGPSQTDAPGSNPRNGVTVTFVDETNRNLHLATNDAGAKDYGADLSGDSYFAFTTDIDAQTRSGTWDIGADEFMTTGLLYSQIERGIRGLNRGFVGGR